MWQIQKFKFNNKIIIIIKEVKIGPLMTHAQLLEGLKEESQVEDSGKREGVGAHSLICNTRGVEGCGGAPGLGLGRVTSFIHLLEPASN
jgi:hypothetical protein